MDKNVNINKNVNRNNVKNKNWEHNADHRRGVKYNNANVNNKFAKADIRNGDRKLDYRGRGGDQVLKPDGGNRPGGGERLARDALGGLAGAMTITVTAGQHTYDFTYTLDEAG